eukprot:TRINITY_DN5064_c0_g1_i1.p1 TRINITY_DN5064_c0_g1~~TRINITY_DN5064_c0_g1_i1.p1  ORF type:complete len:287 (-),score=8.90 TRINITY_DN5064_c0_g1_i1:286-1146(-)
MGSLHLFIIASFLLISAGIRHLACSISSRLKSSCQYSARPWYFSDQNKKNFDIFIILLLLPIGAFSEIYSYFTWNGTATVAVSFLDQAVLLFAFWIICIFIFMIRNSETLAFAAELIFFAAGFVFLLESLVVKRGVSGLEFEWYNRLSFISLICAASCFILAFNLNVFLAELGLGWGLVLQGTWILQTGLSLFIPLFIPRGCHRLSEKPANGESPVLCTLDEETLRAVALIDVLFICYSFFVLLCTVAVLLLSVRNQNGKKEGHYSPISMDTNHVQMLPVSKVGIE